MNPSTTAARRLRRDFEKVTLSAYQSVFLYIMTRVANKQADRRIVRSLEYGMIRDRRARSILTTV